MSANILVVSIGLSIAAKKENKTYSSMEACMHGMKSIFSHNAKEDLVHKKVSKDLKSLHFDVENISLIKIRNGLSCDVVVKDKKGFRSYRVSLEKNSKYPHLYRIYNVQGQKLVSSYQWRDK